MKNTEPHDRCVHPVEIKHTLSIKQAQIGNIDLDGRAFSSGCTQPSQLLRLSFAILGVPPSAPESIQVGCRAGVTLPEHFSSRDTAKNATQHAFYKRAGPVSAQKKKKETCV